MLGINGEIDCTSGKQEVCSSNNEKAHIMDDMLRRRKGKIISCAKDTIEQGE